MIASPQIDIATLEDIDALATLREGQGWQRSEALLHALIAWEHGRIFVLRESALTPDAEHGNDPVATTSALAAGPIGIVGNVIVRADYRRRGLGKRIMRATLDWLRERGVTTMQLDATDDGQPLYASLGFVHEEKSYYAHAPIATLDRDALAKDAGNIRAHLADTSELERVGPLDAAAFGGDRLGFLALVAASPHTWLYIADEDGAPSGYLLVRALEAPYVGIRVGPLAARSPGAAASLLLAALDDAAPWRRLPALHDAEPRLVASIASGNPATRPFFERVGATIELDDVVMRMTVPTTADTTKPAEIAHPDWLYCWLAPMVF